MGGVEGAALRSPEWPALLLGSTQRPLRRPKAHGWYAGRSSAAGRGFREELQRAVEAVSEAPEGWPRYGARDRRYVFPRYPFSLIYRLHEAGDVEVIAVAHGRRRPRYWQRRVGSVP